MTLFQKFDESLSDELIEKLKGLGDRNLGDTQGAIYAIFYTLLAGLIRRANSDMSTNMLVNQIKRINDKYLKDFNSQTDFNSVKSLTEFVDLGEKNMSQIFPSFKSQLLNLVIAHSGTGKNETSKYTGFVNALIIKFLAEKLESGISKDELMNYLKEHRDPLFEKAPESLVEKMIPALGLHDLRNMKMYYAKKKEEKENGFNSSESSESKVEEPTYDYEEDNSSLKKWLLIGGIVALVAVLGYFIYDSREELFGSKAQNESSVIEIPEDEMAELDTLAVETVIPETLDSEWSLVKDLLNATTLDSNSELKLTSLSFGKDSLELSNLNNPFIDSLVTTFKSNPRFQIQIKGGHVDGNSQIAIRRAFNLKRILQSKGVDPVKIDAISDPENLDYLKINVISK